MTIYNHTLMESLSLEDGEMSFDIGRYIVHFDDYTPIGESIKDMIYRAVEAYNETNEEDLAEYEAVDIQRVFNDLQAHYNEFLLDEIRFEMNIDDGEIYKDRYFIVKPRDLEELLVQEYPDKVLGEIVENWDEDDYEKFFNLMMDETFQDVGALLDKWINEADGHQEIFKAIERQSKVDLGEFVE